MDERALCRHDDILSPVESLFQPQKMSLIYYKLKNAIQQNSVTFDGSVIQIGDVKRLVAEKQGLGSEGYHEITLYDPNTGDEYDNDSKVVPRNTLVEVKRKPAATFAPLTSQQRQSDARPLETRTISAAVASQRDGIADDTNTDASQALEDFAKGTASTWQREVRQGVMRGRGRGRGVVPAEYRCPRCEVYGAHWIQDCPTHGDPTYDRKRIRPPVGIPMTRLARSSEGGLVLPDGNTGTLIANEDAFAREVLGIGTSDVNQKEPTEVLAIEGSKMPEKEAPDSKQQEQQQGFGFMPFSISSMSTAAPQLAGMSLKLSSTSQKVDEKDNALFELLKYPELPRGPRDFLLKAYNRDTPLSQEDFEREQDRYNKKGSRSKKSSRRHRSRSRSTSRRRHVNRRYDRSRSRSRSKSKERRSSRSKSRERRRRRSRSKSKERRRRRSGSRERRRRTHRNDSRDSPRRQEDPNPGIKEKRAVSFHENKTNESGPKIPKHENKEASHSQGKHSPIRWNKSTSPRNGASFAGQDEEPDLDYGESDDNIPEEEASPATKGIGKGNESPRDSRSRREREDRSRNDKTDRYRERDSKSRRDRSGYRYSDGKERSRRR